MVDASDLPISIIVVGVGDAEFTTTKQMHSEVKKLTEHGNHIVRDVVQFACFKEYLNKYDETSGSFHLAKHLLADIPNQLVTYMKFKQISPKNIKIFPCVK